MRARDEHVPYVLRTHKSASAFMRGAGSKDEIKKRDETRRGQSEEQRLIRWIWLGVLRSS